MYVKNIIITNRNNDNNLRKVKLQINFNYLTLFYNKYYRSSFRLRLPATKVSITIYNKYIFSINLIFLSHI